MDINEAISDFIKREKTIDSIVKISPCNKYRYLIIIMLDKGMSHPEIARYFQKVMDINIPRSTLGSYLRRNPVTKDDIKKALELYHSNYKKSLEFENVKSINEQKHLDKN